VQLGPLHIHYLDHSPVHIRKPSFIAGLRLIYSTINLSKISKPSFQKVKQLICKKIFLSSTFFSKYDHGLSHLISTGPFSVHLHRSVTFSVCCSDFVSAVIAVPVSSQLYCKDSRVGKSQYIYAVAAVFYVVPSCLCLMSVAYQGTHIKSKVNLKYACTSLDGLTQPARLRHATFCAG